MLSEILIAKNAVTYNTYTATIKGKFNTSRVGRSLVRDDPRFSASCFSVRYSVTNVPSPLRTLVLPDQALLSRTLFRACMEFCALELFTHARNLREWIFVQLSNFCCRKFRQQMSDGAYIHTVIISDNKLPSNICCQKFRARVGSIRILLCNNNN